MNTIMRPPFEYEISYTLFEKINTWVDYLEGIIDLSASECEIVRTELFQEARCIDGSGHTNNHDEEIIRYYLYGGWEHGQHIS